jgi:superfamily II DNA or RNA helicase
MKKNIFESDAYRTHMRRLYSSLYPYQNDANDKMKTCDRLTICFPTGTGKSLDIYVDMLENFKDKSNDVFVIASHRLMLNSQHLTDMFETFKCLLGYIGFIFVGSDPYKEISQNPEYNNILKEQKLNFKDIISSTTSPIEIKNAIERHKKANRDIVIVSTYHSLDRLSGIDIHTLYCDEAQTLASDMTESQFKSNFELITAKRNFFFTATPKDSFDEETDLFLMNNKNIFGERFGLKFKDAVECGYITRPIIHLATPSNYDPSKKFKSVENDTLFIKETFIEHGLWLKSISVNPKLIAPKLLVKCSSVDDMWGIYRRLVKDEGLKDVHMFAGASRNDGGAKEQHNGEPVDSRDEFLRSIKDLKNNESAIILHYDILSEGINVPGITGVFFAVEKLPTKPKILQNAGRSTRLFEIDREKLKRNQISTNDYSEWIKPACAIILPITDFSSEGIVNEISKTIKDMRDSFGFNPAYLVSGGDDKAKGKKEDDDLTPLNNKNKKDKSEFIKSIDQEIERLDEQDDLRKILRKSEKCETREEILDFINNLNL